MRRLTLILAVSTLLMACGQNTKTTTREAGVLYLLPLGDSITQADRHRASYRYPLWVALQGLDQQVDFVGSRTRHHKGNGPAVDPVGDTPFDRDHEGHWGWRTDEVLADLPDWISHYPVDVALVHLGTNDVLQGQSNESTLGELAEIVAILRKHNPQVAVLLARPGQSNWPNAALLPSLAEGIETLSATLDTDGSRVITVAIDRSLSPDHTYDGLHPNASGEALIAQHYLHAMKTHDLLGSADKN